MKYVFIIEGDEGAYCGYYPDVPGCISAGESLDGIKANALEALELHLEGSPAPESRELSEILTDPEVLENLDGTESFVQIAYHAEPVATA